MRKPNTRRNELRGIADRMAKEQNKVFWLIQTDEGMYKIISSEDTEYNFIKYTLYHIARP